MTFCCSQFLLTSLGCDAGGRVGLGPLGAQSCSSASGFLNPVNRTGSRLTAAKISARLLRGVSGREGVAWVAAAVEDLGCTQGDVITSLFQISLHFTLHYTV